jgi:ubiquinone/menaquinone biosynthesis C-methylase UbiE
VISSARAPIPDDFRSSSGAEPLVTVQDDAREDELTRVLRSQLRVSPGASIVEVGCGTGELAAWFARFEPNAKVVGVDASVAMLRRAAERAELGHLRRLSFVLGNVNYLPFEDGSADLVACKHLLCALYDLDRALEEMTRVVKPGGVVLAIEPASAHLFHDPEDTEFATLSQRLNQAFYQGWRRRGVDQRIGLKVPGMFLRHGLEQIRVEVVSRVHLLGDVLRSADDVREQLETESYGLPESTIKLVLDGGMSRYEIEEHNRRTRERLRRFLDDAGHAARSGYTRLAPAVIVTIGRKARPM